MSSEEDKVKCPAPRLSQTERAKLIKEYEEGIELSNPNYYIIKNKNGKLNVRRKKQTKKEEEKSNVPEEVNENVENVEEKPIKSKKPKAL